MKPLRTLLPSLVSVTLAACFSPASAAEPSVNAFYIGHSLISDIPDMLKSIAGSTPSTTFTFKEQFIPGAPLRWQWDKVAEFKGEPMYRVRFDEALATGRYDALVVTDGVPRGGKELEAETADYLARFASAARQHNPSTRVFYYETWHHVTSGTPDNSPYDTASPRRTLRWRERLDADRPMWESIVASANQQAPAGPGTPPIRIIPAGQALARFDDAVRAGKVPGFTDTRSFFDDDIHLNHHGKYLVACVHYAVLFGKSPVGLSFDVKGRWGHDYWDRAGWDGKIWKRPDPAAMLIMQEIAWSTVAGHPHTGIPAAK